MSAEFFDEEAAIEEVRLKLVYIKETLAPLVKDDYLDPNLVPKAIREEIVQILDEHGGIDILSDITKLSFNAINVFHRRWLYNPYTYKTADPKKPRKVHSVIKNSMGSV